MKKRAAGLFASLFREKSAAAAFLFLCLTGVLCLCLPLLLQDPNTIDVTAMLQGASSEHWFGTDELGRDYFLRTLYGGRVSLSVALAAMAASGVIGVSVGLLSGYFGGWVDGVLMRLVDVLCAIPWLILVTVVSLFLRPGYGSVILVLGLFTWMELARMVRAETLSLKQREYVLFAKANGASSFHILLRHILPGLAPTVIVACTSNIAGAILTESSLSFLGLGIQPPMSSWGNLLQSAQNNLQAAPHMVLLPGLFILLTVLAFNRLGDFLQDHIEHGEGGEQPCALQE